jgi:hypothetical protein
VLPAVFDTTRDGSLFDFLVGKERQLELADPFLSVVNLLGNSITMAGTIDGDIIMLFNAL